MSLCSTAAFIMYVHRTVFHSTFGHLSDVPFDLHNGIVKRLMLLLLSVPAKAMKIAENLANEVIVRLG